MIIDEDEIASSFFPLSFYPAFSDIRSGTKYWYGSYLDTITNTLELKKIWVFIKTFSRFGQISPPNSFQITTLWLLAVKLIKWTRVGWTEAEKKKLTAENGRQQGKQISKLMDWTDEFKQTLRRTEHKSRIICKVSREHWIARPFLLRGIETVSDRELLHIWFKMEYISRLSCWSS